MLTIVGIVVVIISVIGGFILEGGPVLVLIQVAEFMIIGGSAIGALLISTPSTILKKIINNIIKSLKGTKTTKQTYLDLLKLLYELFSIIRKDGLIAIESHIERPEESSVFKNYPQFLSQHHTIEFISDTLRLVIMGGVPPHEIELLMDADIELHHHEGSKPGMILQKIGDSLPGLGIVAAVLGIVITMQAINGPPEEIGHKVAAALVGTFLGVFASYGFIQPLATNLDLSNDDETRIFHVIKSGIICAAKGLNPILSVEFARRSIASDFRPSFQEMESYVKGTK
ncbi:MAG TPA: flagellar motor stator protein MotA [Syntrophorhabdaceae bacterium]|nr:flagellar motor stator protein MotA [Syntrophorhabdaceae bacterium]